MIQNDTSPIGFYMTLTASNLPATGKTLTGVVSKNGGAFAAAAGTFAEQSNGMYNYTPTAGEVNTLGDLRIIASASGCWDQPFVDRVVQAGPVASDYTSARAAKIDNLDAAISTRASASTQTTMANTVATNLDATISSRASATALSSGVTLTSGERSATASAILGTVIETNGGVSFTVQKVLQAIGAFIIGKISGITAGTGSQTTVVRSMTDSQTAITYTDDDLGNRTAVVTTLP